MSGYLARLKALIAEDTDTRLTDATDKSPCVSFVSDQDRHVSGDEAAIEERAGLADRVPSVYLDVWARLNCQKPASVSEAAWRLALDDGGRFLDGWGADAATMLWTAGELFDVPRGGRAGGLVWQLRGERVEALGVARARLRAVAQSGGGRENDGRFEDGSDR